MFEKIRAMIAEQLGMDESQIREDSNLREDLGADSLDQLELIMAVEEEFGIEIPVEDLGDVTTLKDVIDYLNDKGIC